MLESILDIDQTLLKVLVKSTRDGLSMANLKPVPIGTSRVLHSRGEVSSIVGFVGGHSGTLIINATSAATCFMAGRMLGETLNTLDHQALDGLSEIVNIIAGQAKAALSTTEYRFERISVPSVVVGNSYAISHYRGMRSVTVEFELPEMPFRPGDPGTFDVNISMMKI